MDVEEVGADKAAEPLSVGRTRDRVGLPVSPLPLFQPNDPKQLVSMLNL